MPKIKKTAANLQGKSSIVSKCAALLFSPGTTLMNHLDITRKFIVLVLMSCFAIGIVVYSLFTSLEQTTTILQQELDGIALIKPYTQLIQVTQQHRGLSSVRLGNDKTITDLQATKASDVTKHHQATDDHQ